MHSLDKTQPNDRARLVGWLALGLALAVPAAATYPGQNGRIACAGKVPGEAPRILALHPEVGALTDLLTGYPGGCRDGTWSPDGARFAFAHSTDEHASELFVLVKGQAIQLRLTTTNALQPAASASDPDWSPDGDRLAFTLTRPEQPPAVWVVSAKGLGQALLLANASAARWSPDRSRIAFVRDCQIWVRDLATAREQQLTRSEVGPYPQHGEPAWSPDGSRIAYTQVAPGRVSRSVWIMAADGGQPFRLTTLRANDDQPEWSPDGRRLAFISDRDRSGARLYLCTPSADPHLLDERLLGAIAGYGSLAHPRWESLRPPSGASSSKIPAESSQPPGGAPLDPPPAKPLELRPGQAPGGPI